MGLFRGFEKWGFKDVPKHNSDGNDDKRIWIKLNCHNSQNGYLKYDKIYYYYTYCSIRINKIKTVGRHFIIDDHNIQYRVKRFNVVHIRCKQRDNIKLYIY